MTLRITLAAAAALGLVAAPALARQASGTLPMQTTPPSHEVVGQGATAEQAASGTSLGRKLGVHHHRSHHHRSRHHSARSTESGAMNEPVTAPATTTPPPAASSMAPPVAQTPPSVTPAPANPAAVPPATTGTDATAPGH